MGAGLLQERMSRSATCGGNELSSSVLAEAFASESRRGALLAIVVYAVWSGALTINFLIDVFSKNGFPAVLRVPPALLVQAILSVLLPIPIYFIAARSKAPLLWCFISMLADILIWAQGKFFWFSMPAVFAHAPLFLEVRYGDILSFMVLLAIYVLPLSRAFIVWGGAAILIVWTVGIVHAFLSYHGATLYWGPLGSNMGDSAVRAMMDPETLTPDFFIIQILLAAAYVFFLALSIRRARRYVIDRVTAQADSAFLERFFPPQVSAQIAADKELAPSRRHVAILFAHIRAPAGSAGEDLLQMQAWRSAFEKIAFSHGGVLDRFTGGPIMVSFGALYEDGEAATKALDCAREATRNAETGSLGLSVALHAGDTVCGDVGGTHSRVFSVVGDAVNVTRRILDTSEGYRRPIIASGEFAREASHGREIEAEALGDVILRGREAPVQLWSFSS